MKRTLLTAAGLALLALSVSACGSGGGGGGGLGGGTTTPPPASFASQFGPGFGAAFGAGANTEPRDLAAADVIAPSLTAEPVPLPGT